MEQIFEVDGIAYRLIPRSWRMIYSTVHESSRNRLDEEIVVAEVIARVGGYDGELVIPSEITIGQEKYPVWSIADDAFRECDCSSLRKVYIPASIDKIGFMSNPFCNCSSLESLDVAADSENFYSIDGILYSKVKIELIAIPAALKNKKVSIPITVESARYGAFSSMRAESIEVYGNCLLEHDNDTMGQSKDLKHVIIGAGVTYIGDTCFYECTTLETVTFCNRDNNEPGKAGRYYTNNEGNMVADDSDLKIDYCAFHRCASLKEISIPANTVIENFAFAGCDSLVEVVVGKDSKLTGTGIFEGCQSLRTIIIYAPMKALGEDSLRGCDSLAQIIIRNCSGNNFDEAPIRKHCPNVEIIYEE